MGHRKKDGGMKLGEGVETRDEPERFIYLASMPYCQVEQSAVEQSTVVPEQVAVDSSAEPEQKKKKGGHNDLLFHDEDSSSE